MSTHAPETPPPGPVISLENLLFDYPRADVILCSCDSYEFRTLKMYIYHSSPILGEQVLAADNPQPGIAIPTDIAATLPVVQLPDSGAVLFSLLTYIFPVQPILPSTVEQVMELLSAAQKYKMDAVLTHIRNHIAQQHPPILRQENSLYMYFLAQKHGLRQEVLQAAQSTLGLPNLAIGSLDEKLEMMPGVFLHELWKYQHRVRANLTTDLEVFVASRAHTTFNQPCPTALLGTGIPAWLDQYISSIGMSPSLFDLSQFHMALTGHIQSLSGSRQGAGLGAGGGCHACAMISSKSILDFWAALSTVYRDSITKAESDLLLVDGGTNFESHPSSPGGRLQPQYTDMPDADVVLRSSDLINFRVRKSILATSTPFFDDLFSLPQPPGHQLADDLPVVHLPEDAEVLNSLVTMLYPVPPELPDSDDKILTLLSACQKYDMTAVQSSIRAEISRRGLLSPTGAESFRLFAVAYRKRLIPETKAAARLTLSYPMTFEYLGEALRSFEGCALFDLSLFRQCCRHSIASRFEALWDYHNGPSKVWLGCPLTPPSRRLLTPPGEEDSGNVGDPPLWLEGVFSLQHSQLSVFKFTSPFVTPSSFCEKYLKALRGHVSEEDCTFCMKTHTLKGKEFCAEIENELAQAWDVQYSFSIENPASKSTAPPSV